MAEPVNPKKMTPFQEAMLKFEQAVRESLEAEQAAQRAARQPMPAARQAPPRPQARPVGYPTAQPGRPVAYQTRPADQQPQAPQTVEEAAVMAHQAAKPVTAIQPQPHGSEGDISPITATEPAGKLAVSEAARQKAEAAAYNLPIPLAQLSQAPNPLIQGVIWAEVLGKPVCKRRGRGRYGI